MKNSKSLFKRAIIKILGLLLAGVFTSMISMAYFDTYSWFTSSNATDISVSAANTSDIISLFHIDNRNPKTIKVQRAQGLNYSPVVYFEVGGLAGMYLEHINPCKLMDDKVYNLDIGVNVSLEQLIDLMCNKSQKTFKGWIILKYLNEFIIWKAEYEFTRNYLISEGLKNILDISIDSIPMTQAASDDTNEDEINYMLAQLALYIASLRDWKADEASLSGLSTTTAEHDGLLSGEVKLNESQIAMIKTIAPALLDYAAELYGEYTALVSEYTALNDKYSNETSSMKETIESLQSEIAKLQSLISSLQEQIKKDEGKDYNTGDGTGDGTGTDGNQSGAEPGLNPPLPSNPPVETQPPTVSDTEPETPPPLETEPPAGPDSGQEPTLDIEQQTYTSSDTDTETDTNTDTNTEPEPPPEIEPPTDSGPEPESLADSNP